jgi:Na+-transporting NADH:ubiquinone oxidoreductase subunit NqrF
MSVNIITLYGKASDSSKYLRYTQEDLKLTVLEYLQKQDVPIASSCKGRAACHRCKINDEILACDITLEEFINNYNKKIIIDYL